MKQPVWHFQLRAFSGALSLRFLDTFLLHPNEGISKILAVSLTLCSLDFYPCVAWQSEAGERIAVSKYQGGVALKKKKSAGFIMQKKNCMSWQEQIYSRNQKEVSQHQLSGTNPFVRAEMTKQLSAFKSGKFVKREPKMSVTTRDRRRLCWVTWEASSCSFPCVELVSFPTEFKQYWKAQCMRGNWF